jgi:pilus assembly protein CpaE
MRAENPRDLERNIMKTTVICRHENSLQELRRLLAKWDSNMPVTALTAGVDKVFTLIQQSPPDVLIVEAECAGDDELSHLDTLTERFPNMTVMLLCKAPTPEVMQHAMRLGIRELLTEPLKRDQLHDAMQRAHRRSQGRVESPKLGRVMSWVGCKGGSGQTFLASNFAYALSRADRTRVALIDLNLQFGDAVLFLADHKPQFSVADLAGSQDRLDAALLGSSMAHLTPTLDALSAPESLEAATQVKPDQVEAIVQLAAQNYDYVVMDLGRNMDARTLRAMDLSDDIFMVVQLTLPFIRDCKRLLETLDALGQRREKLHLVVNRYEKGGEITLDKLEAALGRKVFQTIPNSYTAVASSVNLGKPLLDIAKSDPVARALVKVAESFTHPDKPQEQERSLFNWFKSPR